MQDRKSKRKSSNKVTPTSAPPATKQPYNNLDFPTQKLFELLEEFYGNGGASQPTAATSFLLTQFFSTDHMPAHEWGKEFVANTIWDITQLNNFVVKVYEIWEWKKAYDEKVKEMRHV